MKKIITQLWNGELEPINDVGKNNPEIEHLMDLIKHHTDKLEEGLDEKSCKIFQKYYDCINEYITLIVEEAFCDGFCLGTKITVEGLAE